MAFWKILLPLAILFTITLFISPPLFLVNARIDDFRFGTPEIDLDMLSPTPGISGETLKYHNNKRRRRCSWRKALATR